MMQPASTDESIENVTQKLARACELLREAEIVFRTSMEGQMESEDRDSVLLESALEIATHEVQSQLEFLVDDVVILLRRIQVRREFSVISDAVFEEIIGHEWSLALVTKLHQMPICARMTLAETSALVRAVQTKWSALSPNRSE